MRRQALFVDFIAMSINDFYKLHYNQKSKSKEICMRHVIKSVEEFNIEKIDYPVKITFQPILGNNLSGRSKRAYDIVNYAATIKMIEDSLVQLDVLVNDDNKFVYAHTCEKAIVDRTVNRTGILVIIEEQSIKEDYLEKLLKKNKIVL